MAADKLARGVGLILGALLGLTAVQGLAASSEQAHDLYDRPAEPAQRPIWLYELPAQPALPADPDAPAAPASLQILPETR